MNNGYLLLRIDDTDTERSKPEFEAAIYESLTWLGITWDELAHQSKRLDRYNEVIEQLKADGRLYACYETPKNFSLKRKSQLSQGLPPIYDRGSLNLSADQKPNTKNKVANLTGVSWWKINRLSGRIWSVAKSVWSRDISDPVLIREDGTPLYHLCSVIDDGDFGMTHIVRGEDHVSNTASHIQMFEAIGTTLPQFAHLPLISDAKAEELSKRLGSLSIIQLRDEIGLEPLSISSL